MWFRVRVKETVERIYNLDLPNPREHGIDMNSIDMMETAELALTNDPPTRFQEVDAMIDRIVSIQPADDELVQGGMHGEWVQRR